MPSQYVIRRAHREWQVEILSAVSSAFTSGGSDGAVLPSAGETVERVARQLWRRTWPTLFGAHRNKLVQNWPLMGEPQAFGSSRAAAAGGDRRFATITSGQFDPDNRRGAIRAVKEQLHEPRHRQTVIGFVPSGCRHELAAGNPKTRGRYPSIRRWSGSRRGGVPVPALWSAIRL